MSNENFTFTGYKKQREFIAGINDKEVVELAKKVSGIDPFTQINNLMKFQVNDNNREEFTNLVEKVVNEQNQINENSRPSNYLIKLGALFHINEIANAEDRMKEFNSFIKNATQKDISVTDESIKAIKTLYYNTHREHLTEKAHEKINEMLRWEQEMYKGAKSSIDIVSIEAKFDEIFEQHLRGDLTFDNAQIEMDAVIDSDYREMENDYQNHEITQGFFDIAKRFGLEVETIDQQNGPQQGDMLLNIDIDSEPNSYSSNESQATEAHNFDDDAR